MNDTNNTTRRAVAKFSTADLQTARKAIEAEQIAACTAQAGRMTQANVGQLEMLEAIGAELSARNSLLEALAGPAWVEVDREDGFRLSFSVRVF